MENQESPLRVTYDRGKVFLLLSDEEEDNGSWQLVSADILDLGLS